MSVKRIVLAAAGLILVPTAALALNTFAISTNLTKLGTNVYRYEFTLSNLGPDQDPIFKWAFDNVDAGWRSFGFDLPDGWEARYRRRRGRLVFRTGNTDFNFDRIYGGQSKTFAWTFRTRGGSVPSTDWLGRVHFQAVDDQGMNLGRRHRYRETTPSPNPEPATLLLVGGGLLGLAGYRRFRRS